MAKIINSKIFLGFVDEIVSEKYVGQVDFTTNKIGGSPDVPSNVPKLENPKCPICNLPRALVVQVYAPLENSYFHRTVYLFGCVNSMCWGSNNSWACFRVQSLNNSQKLVEDKKSVAALSTTDWCSVANDWGEEDCLDTNFDFPDDKNISANLESMSIEEEITATENEPQPSAEIEETPQEKQNVILDPPAIPETNLINLLRKKTPLLPQNIRSNLEFVPYFMSVWEEESVSSQDMDDHHVKNLLEKYEKQNELDLGNKQNSSNNMEEKYEKSTPIHGDKLFQKFLMRIQKNPGQILRYNHNGAALLIDYLKEQPQKCQHCEGSVVFEFQLVPTIIPKLRLKDDKEENIARLDFGTVLVYTCKSSCWSEADSFKIESVVLQMETIK